MSQRVVAELELSATPTPVAYNDTVTVTASISPAQAGGFNVPWTIDSVRWTPDAFGAQTSPCTWNLFVPNSGDSPTRICRRPFTRSGTLTVSATVNGEFKQKAVQIEVTPPELNVTASPAAIAGPQSVTFTAAVMPSTVTWNVSSWTWRPDSGTGGISPSNCAWTEKVCTRTISKSGWMKATATIGEYTLNDSTHVRIIPCATGDSIADLQEVRQALDDALSASNASDPTFTNRIERSGLLLRNLQTGGVDVVRFDQLYADWCVSGNDFKLDQTKHRLLGVFHTHPFSPNGGDIIPYCIKTAIDPATGLAAPVQPPAIAPGGVVGPGGSPEDWVYLTYVNQLLSQNALAQVDAYIIDLDYIYRLDHGQNPHYTKLDYKSCPNWLQ